MTADRIERAVVEGWLRAQLRIYPPYGITPDVLLTMLIQDIPYLPTTREASE